MAIKTTELICTSQSWDGATLPDFPQGRPELRVIRLDFPVGAKTGSHIEPKAETPAEQPKHHRRIRFNFLAK